MSENAPDTEVAEREQDTGEQETGGQDAGEQEFHGTDTVELQLGACHYGGFEEDATLMASRSDGTGWIAVCENHRQQAEEEGFEIVDNDNIGTPIRGEGDDGASGAADEPDEAAGDQGSGD